ncbi:FimV/HubP family polar landmark protein [Paraburkholderia sacchari]|uniref:FimV/HubP family polar landmark protein n=1 Tax=Paraburkholderia sacchari TaxID=159450 RepID=UPI00068A3986|nr:FimV/HubP family polar landmark protein [Paraburkholderia sacchari]
MRRTAVAVSAALLVAMAGASGMAYAQGGAAGASAPAAALPVVGQYTVRPGQSLHDVAVDVTQSHDKTVIARASQALFDANPAAFMKRDPSRLKVGAVLNVPGTPDMASAAAGASAPAASVAASAPGASAVVVAAASSAAAAPASTTAAAATGASAAANAGALATNGASGAAGASAPEAGASAASAQALSAASAEASASAAPAAASDPHSWSGAVQAAPPSAAASGASATPGSAASTPTVSSLQQLLALKNRVLMALQQHGIGKPAPVAGAPAGAQGNAAAGGAAQGANGAQPEISPTTLGGVAAVMLAFVALIVRVLMRKRRKLAPEASESAIEPPAATRPTERDDAMAEPVKPAAPLATGAAAAAAAAVEAKAESPVELPSRDAAHDHGEHTEPGDDALPPEDLALPMLGETIEPVPQPEAPHQAKADIDETSAAAREASRAEPRPIELTMPGAHSEPHAPTVEAQAPVAPAEPAVPPAPETVAPGDHATPAFPPEQQAEVAMPHVEVTQEFPKSALDALGGLDMPLPPRVETPEPMPGAPLSTEPVATPETTARQALPFAQPPVPPAGAAIEAGIAGAGSIAGLGAPRFGTLTLDFDLNLPSDSADPLPVFTPEQLSRIARNKLDLAHEYIALGDLSGARALINEVIESNDHATRADAQALLSTLSPLS